MIAEEIACAQTVLQVYFHSIKSNMIILLMIFSALAGSSHSEAMLRDVEQGVFLNKGNYVAQHFLFKSFD